MGKVKTVGIIFLVLLEILIVVEAWDLYIGWLKKWGVIPELYLPPLADYEFIPVMVLTVIAIVIGAVLVGLIVYAILERN